MTNFTQDDIIQAIKRPTSTFSTFIQASPLCHKGEEAVTVKVFGSLNGYFPSDAIAAAKIYPSHDKNREEHYKYVKAKLDGWQLPHLLPIHYYEDEFLFFRKDGKTECLPALLMGWAGRGCTLDEFIPAHLHDKDAMEALLYQFCHLAIWLREQPFVHRNVRSDNILYQAFAPMALVDYDTLCFREETEDDYPKYADDLNLIAIGLSLRLLCINPDAWDKFYHPEDGLILVTKEDCQHYETCELVKYAKNYVSDRLLRLFLNEFQQCCQYGALNWYSEAFWLVPERTFIDDLSIPYDSSAIRVPHIDGGVKYSYDRTCLIKATPYLPDEYAILEGTSAICPNAFENCQLQNLQLPHSLKQIGAGGLSYSDIENITSLSPLFKVAGQAVYNADMTTLISSFSRSPQFKVPETIRHICAKAFAGNKRLKEIELPEGITEIEEETFSGCTALQKVVLPSTLEKIGDRAFFGTTELKKLHLPSSVKSIGKSCFTLSGLEAQYTPPRQELKKVAQKVFLENTHTIPEGTTSIEFGTFRNLTAETLVIPEGVESLEDFACSGCHSLKRVELPSSLLEIGYWAFSDCTSLEEVTIRGAVRVIGIGTFRQCESLRKIIFPPTLKKIGIGAFSGCTSLEEIWLPSQTLIDILSLPLQCKLIEYKTTATKRIPCLEWTIYPKERAVSYPLLLPTLLSNDTSPAPYLKVITRQSILSVSISKSPRILGNRTLESALFTPKEWRQLCLWLNKTEPILQQLYKGEITGEEARTECWKSSE